MISLEEESASSVFGTRSEMPSFYRSQVEVLLPFG